MKTIVETERLIIREFEEEDLLRLYKIESNPKIIEFMPWNKLSNLNECSKQIRKYISNYDRNKLNSWAIVEKQNNEVIGITQLVYTRKINGIEIGTKILPEYWSKGYASELTKAVVHYGLYELGNHEIIAVTNINNVGAIKSLLKMGMIFKKYGYYNGAESAFFSAKKIK